MPRIETPLHRNFQCQKALVDGCVWSSSNLFFTILRSWALLFHSHLLFLLTWSIEWANSHVATWGHTQYMGLHSIHTWKIVLIDALPYSHGSTAVQVQNLSTGVHDEGEPEDPHGSPSVQTSIQDASPVSNLSEEVPQRCSSPATHSSAHKSA